ncbi:MAG: helix-turn-helix domain-containing protein [Acidimicrobiales bacterium]
MADYTPTQVAELLGVTADTVRRWCDEGRLAATRSEGGQRTIDGADLARHLSERGRRSHDSLLPQSARNRLTGIVTRVERDGLRRSSRSTHRRTASCP